MTPEDLDRLRTDLYRAEQALLACRTFGGAEYSALLDRVRELRERIRELEPNR